MLHLPAVTYSLQLHEIILSGGTQKTRQGGRQWQGVSDGLTVGSAPSAARLGLAARPEQKTLSLQPFPLGQWSEVTLALSDCYVSLWAVTSGVRAVSLALYMSL